jgi:hypothetical protein
MATFTAYDPNHQPIANFDYGIVSLINAVLNREDYDGKPMYLEPKELPALKSLLDRVNIGFNTSEIVKPSTEHSWYHWSYQIQPGESHFRVPISTIMTHLSSKNVALTILED